MPVPSQPTAMLETARQHCDAALSSLRTYLEAANVEPKAALYAVLVFLTSVYLVQKLVRYVQGKRSQKGARPVTPTNLEKRPFKAQEREFGGEFLPHTSPTPPKYLFHSTIYHLDTPSTHPARDMHLTLHTTASMASRPLHAAPRTPLP